MEMIINIHMVGMIQKKLINIYGIASAMSYLHSQRIIHRDLKSGNILEDDHFYPRIADFGLSKNLDTSNTSSSGVKGTPSYIPPEVWEGNDWTEAGDVYSFSIVSYEILTGKNPFENCDDYRILYCITIDKIRPKFDESVPKCYQNLVEQCWSQNPADRPSFNEITDRLKKNDDFITENINKNEFLSYIDKIEQERKGCINVEEEEDNDDNDNEKPEENFDIEEEKEDDQNNKEKGSYLDKEFKCSKYSPFEGILRFLTKKTGGNICDNGTISITSNSSYESNHLKNLVDYENRTFIIQLMMEQTMFVLISKKIESN